MTMTKDDLLKGFQLQQELANLEQRVEDAVGVRVKGFEFGTDYVLITIPMYDQDETVMVPHDVIINGSYKEWKKAQDQAEVDKRKRRDAAYAEFELMRKVQTLDAEQRAKLKALL